MFRNVNDLSQLFADAPAPRRIADAVRSKIEKFKVHLFVLETICNPGQYRYQLTLINNN